ncbi:T9SS type A sorting domain-containing protein [Calditrichota bacterium]
MEVWEDWNGSQWVNEWRHSYTYDSNGNNTLWLVEDWDVSQWVNSARSTFTYNSNGNMILWLVEHSYGSQWRNFLRHTYTYDSNGNMTLEVVEMMNGNQWINTQRITYSYDSNNNIILELEENWNGSQWVNELRYTYTYNSNGNMIYGISENWDGIQWIAADNYYLNFYDSFGRYYYYYGAQIEVFYSPITDISVRNLALYNFSLSQNYPNPFNPVTNISFGLQIPGLVKIDIYNSLGQKVSDLLYENKLSGTYTIQFDGSNLASGIYYYRLAIKSNKISTGFDFEQKRKMLLIK